jgi:hypothetical protein
MSKGLGINLTGKIKERVKHIIGFFSFFSVLILKYLEMINKPLLYILVNRKPVPVANVLEWGKYLDEKNRRVCYDEIGDTLISTVFLGIDHAFHGGPPILFETMIFGGIHDQYQKRCATWEQIFEWK